MKFTIQTIADSVDLDSYFDLYPGYLNADYDENENDFMFNSKEEFEGYAENIIDLFDSFPEEFPVYRAIMVYSEDDIRKDDLGESWSFDLESAREFGRHNGSNIILSAIVTNDNVDWYESMYRYLRFSTGEDIDDENEIVVIDTNLLKNVQINPIKKSKEIGKNPIFTREPYVKNFESWLLENNISDIILNNHKEKVINMYIHRVFIKRIPEEKARQQVINYYKKNNPYWTDETTKMYKEYFDEADKWIRKNI